MRYHVKNLISCFEIRPTLSYSRCAHAPYVFMKKGSVLIPIEIRVWCKREKYGAVAPKRSEVNSDKNAIKYRKTVVPSVAH